MPGKDTIIEAHDSTQLYETVYIARQPVFDDNLNVWGYELLYRDKGRANTAVFSDELEATMRVLSNFSLCGAHSNGSNRVLVNFAPEAISKQIPLILPPDSSVIQINGDVEATQELMDLLKKMQAEGYTIALDDFEAEQINSELLQLADMLVVDTLGKSREDLEKIVSQLHDEDVLLVAKRIEEYREYVLARELGFSYFQGFFFKKPENYEGKKLSSSQTGRLTIFEVLQEDEVDFEALAKAIEVDVSISYRLLAYLNSPSFGFAKKIESIRQAVVLIGWKHVKHWLQVIVLTDIKPTQKTEELSYLCAQRANFLQRIGLEHGYDGKTGQLFMLGLFSALDAMLDTPMPDILATVSLDVDVKKALCGEQGVYANWLSLLKSYEESDFVSYQAIARDIGLELDSVTECYTKSIEWANEIFQNIR